MSWKEMHRMLDRDALLRRIGLEQRSPGSDLFTGLGLFSMGVLVGASFGLFFAPKRGEDMRAMVSEAWRTRRPSRLAELGKQAVAEAGIPPAVTTEQ
jgi:hypothetical protein